MSIRCLFFLAWAGLVACSPALNWRTVRSDAHALQMLLPCKPDHASRDVPMAGSTVALDMQGCDAAGATFAVSHVHLADARQASAALAGWQAATLANLHAANPQQQPLELHGGQFGVRWALVGQRADGHPVSAQAVWFARIQTNGVDLFNAVVVADKVDAAVADTFFTGLKFE
ncbi:MAG: hypothetical protein ABIP34_21840 [Rhodoferax sp.]|uniref:hypothetical protein n=1 Tax=Rhodoferax sp. TaxID=50421 RepID=UPI00326461F4